MCKDILNQAEYQLAIQQMQDLSGHLHAYAIQWKNLLSGKGIDHLQADLMEIEQLSQQLYQRLSEIKGSLGSPLQLNDNVTITEFKPSEKQVP